MTIIVTDSQRQTIARVFGSDLSERIKARVPVKQEAMDQEARKRWEADLNAFEGPGAHPPPPLPVSEQEAWDELVERFATLPDYEPPVPPREDIPRVVDLAGSATEHNFLEIDYVRGLDVRLHPQMTFQRGVLVEKTFHKHLSVDPATQVFTYSDPIIRETFAYQRDDKGFAVSRVQTISWVNRDGSDNQATKTRTKVYTPLESIAETHRRRVNILDQTQVEMLGLLSTVGGMSQNQAIAEGQRFYTALADSITVFRDVGEHWQLIHEITGLTEADWYWLDVELGPGYKVRDHIISRIREIEP